MALTLNSQWGEPPTWPRECDLVLLGLDAYIERNLPRALRRKVAPQDVLQEVSLHALRALPAAAPQGRDPFGWLCQMAQQRIIEANLPPRLATRLASGR